MRKILLALMTFFVSCSLLAAQCAATTQKGTQCKRQASPDSTYCWQHGGTTKAERAAKAAEEEADKARCQATTQNGEQCKRLAAPNSSYCWQHGETKEAPKAAPKKEERAAKKADETTEKARCAGTTKAGEQCRRLATEGSQYCWQHQNGEETAPAKTETLSKEVKETKTKVAEKAAAAEEGPQCDATTKSGARCARKAQPGGTKCWQHAK